MSVHRTGDRIDIITESPEKNAPFGVETDERHELRLTEGAQGALIIKLPQGALGALASTIPTEAAKEASKKMKPAYYTGVDKQQYHCLMVCAGQMKGQWAEYIASSNGKTFRVRMLASGLIVDVPLSYLWDL